MDNVPESAAYYDSLEEDYSSASSTSIVIQIESNFSNDRMHKSFPQSEDHDVYEEDIVEEIQVNVCPNRSSNSYSKVTRTKIPVKNTRQSNSSRSHKEMEQEDLTTKIPLYGRERDKSEVSFTCVSNTSSLSSVSLFRNDSRRNFPRRRSKLKSKSRSKFTLKSNVSSCVSVDSLPNRNLDKSYVAIFHSKIGYPDDSNRKNHAQMGDTVRSIFGDTARSFMSEHSSTEQFQDAEGYDSDSSTFYFKVIENERANNNKNCCKDLLQKSLDPLPECGPPADTARETIMQNGKTPRKSKTNKKSQPSTVASSSLAEDSTIQDKVCRTPITQAHSNSANFATLLQQERRKRQLSYGQKASNRNRIKMIETSILKALRKETEGNS